MTDNKTINFSEIFTFRNGKSRPKSEGKYKVYGSGGLIGTCAETNTDGDISVIGRVGANCGNVFFVQDPSYISDNAIIAKTKESFDSYYGYYLLKDKKLNRLKHGSGQPLINQDTLNGLNTPLLSKQQELSCVELLSSIDKKIELNKRTNETLEEISKTIFKSWFIDFDPVRAKVEGRPTGLPKKISDFFPDSFEESNLGEIPKGWKTVKIGNIAKVTSGKGPPEKKEIRSDTHPFTVFGGAGPIGFCSKPLKFNIPAIITGRVGTLGKVFLLNQECWVSDNSILIYDAEKYTATIYQILKNLNFSSLNVGSTQPLITAKDIKNINLIEPNDSLLDEYSLIFNDLNLRQLSYENQNDTLIEIRDTLLPKLISGKLRIPDVEKLVEESSI